MGFLQDLGSFINDVNSIGDEIDAVKQDVISSLVDSATQIGETLNDTRLQITDAANDVTTTVQQAADDVSQSVHSSDDE